MRIGDGDKPLVVFPGLTDSLSPHVDGGAFYRWELRRLAKGRSLTMISRSRAQPDGHSTRDMAHEYARAFDELFDRPVDIVGFSMGSGIAQHFAADFPGKVRKLVLALAGARPADTTREILTRWIDFARDDHWYELYQDSIDVSFAGLGKLFWTAFVPLMATRPRIPSDFIVAAQACGEHDTRERLAAIKAPTLVIGGEQDRLVPPDMLRELARGIKGSVLALHPVGGHGFTERWRRDFDRAVIAFLDGKELPVGDARSRLFDLPGLAYPTP